MLTESPVRKRVKILWECNKQAEKGYIALSIWDVLEYYKINKKNLKIFFALLIQG